VRYHLALGRAIDLDNIQREAEAGKCPRHVMRALRERLQATVHVPEKDPILLIDTLRSKLIGQPRLWAMARRLAEQLTGGDLVYCTGEDIGIPLATLCAQKRDRPKIVVFINGVHRPRSRVALNLFNAAAHVNLFITNCSAQVDVLKNFYRIPEEKIFLLLEQTDTQFFTPGAVSSHKPRPIIASVGLERRDYRILAATTADLDVDVRISGFSADVTPWARSFPKLMPSNMSQRFYEWTELVQLYRDADLVVVSLFQTAETSGVTTLMEAMACGRPVIVTRTKGLTDYVDKVGTVTPVEPGDERGLRQIIVQLLQNPQKAEALGKQGYQVAQKYHNSEQYVEILATRLVLI
jgi:glycosyltransferase involved in cell wall biosynthesis